MLDQIILIFEQDKKIAKYLNSLVKGFGFPTTVILNSQEIIDKAVDLRPDLVLMDLSNENSKESIKIAGQIYDNTDTCFLFLTDQTGAPVSGEQDLDFQYSVVVKPFQKKELNIAINSLIEKHKLEKKLKDLQTVYDKTINNLNDCVIKTSTGGIIKEINSSASELIGVDRTKALGVEISKIIKVYSTEDKNKKIDLIDNSTIQNFLDNDNNKLYIKDKNGEKKGIKLRVIPFLSVESKDKDGFAFIFNEMAETTAQLPHDFKKEESKSLNYFSYFSSKLEGSPEIDNKKDTEINLDELSRLGSHEFILSSILEATYNLNSTAEILNTIVEVLENSLVSVDFAAAYLVNNNKAELECSKGLTDEFLTDIQSINHSKGLPWSSIISESTVNINNVNESKFTTEAEREIGFQSCISLPIRQNGITIGSLNLFSIQRTGAFSDAEFNLLETICRQIEIVFSYLGKFEELRQSEQRFQSLFDKSPVGVLLLDNSFKIYQCNRRVAEILQTTFDNIVGFDIREFNNEKFTSSVRKMLKGSFSRCEFSLNIPGKKRKVWLLASLSPIKDTDERVDGGMVVLEDITERKKMENAIVEEKEMLSITLKSIGDGVITTDSEGKIILFNRIAEVITEWIQDEAVDKKIEDILTLDPKTPVSIKDKIYGFALQKGKILSIKDDLIIKSKNNREKIINASSSPIRDKENNIIGAVIVFRDITEQQKLKEELLKGQKLESLETLAGGIAHDFNNMLTGIIGNVSLSRMYVDSEDKIYKRLSEAERECFKAADLTKQLINFAEGVPPNKKIASITELVDESVSFVLTGSKVKSSFKSSEDIWLVEVDERQIMQAIYDIVLNSLQAMPRGGNIKTSVQNVTIKQNVNNVIGDGEYVKIVIEDTGTGISEQNLSKIYDPYFTTKDSHAGLGLSNTYTTIKSHKGFMKIDSVEGEGTKVSIYLPARKDVIPLQEEVTRQVFDEVDEGQRGKILVMDDDEVIREIAGAILSYIGYDVAFASDGKEAIDQYIKAKENGEKYDVVIMDLTIPGGMGAEDTIKKLIDIDPEIKAIVSSGYSNAPIISDFYKYGFRGAVTKPFRIEELTKTVKDVLIDKNINTLPI
jgi:PAS domain S-box-containing protein